jgi:hypothetical protein
MNAPPGTSDPQAETVSLWVREFRRRLPNFERARQEELRHLRQDFVERMIGDHIVLGDKSSYDCMLQEMLKEDERDLLRTDPGFTRAWRIFVDLGWAKRQRLRNALVLGGIIAVLLFVALCIFALPYLAGPGSR